MDTRGCGYERQMVRVILRELVIPLKVGIYTFLLQQKHSQTN